MSTFEQLTSNLRDTFDHVSEGWQHMWSKARNAVTRFTPFSEETESDHPLVHRTSRWGVLSAEVRETSESIEVQLEAPGMEADDFELSVRNQSLTISGKKHYQSNRKEGQFHVTERAYGRFERVIPLQAVVDDSNASARYAKGVLTVILPKTDVSPLRNIKVE